MKYYIGSFEDFFDHIRAGNEATLYGNVPCFVLKDSEIIDTLSCILATTQELNFPKAFKVENSEIVVGTETFNCSIAFVEINESITTYSPGENCLHLYVKKCDFCVALENETRHFHNYPSAVEFAYNCEQAWRLTYEGVLIDQFYPKGFFVKVLEVKTYSITKKWIHAGETVQYFLNETPTNAMKFFHYREILRILSFIGESHNPFEIVEE